MINNEDDKEEKVISPLINMDTYQQHRLVQEMQGLMNILLEIYNEDAVMKRNIISMRQRLRNHTAKTRQKLTSKELDLLIKHQRN